MEVSACHGLLVIDKPGGMTSRAVVDRVQRWFQRATKIGHTGTLDPLATGVLVLCIGAATRLTEYVQRMSKTYRAGILLGSRSDTDDADGTITPVEGVILPERAAVESCLSGFIGHVDQLPPSYSAAKVAGRRAYDLARRGKEVTLTARKIHIARIDVLGYEFPRLEIEVRCGKGTYIRSLARDLGERLGCGALIESLRRTRVGDFTDADAIPFDGSADAVRPNLLPLASAVSQLARIQLDETRLLKLRQGQAVRADIVVSPEDEDVAVFDHQLEFVALAKFDRKSMMLHPKKIIIV